MANTDILTQADLRQLLDYDPLTGIFTWRDRDVSIPKNRSWNGQYSGRVAGSVKKSTGYVSISIHDKDYLAHRLAFLWVEGSLPDADTDHVNRDRSDNRFCNLRKATRQENTWNTASHGASGSKGVSWHKRDRKYQALIRDNGANRCLGYFDTKAEAEAAYNSEAEKLRGAFAHHLSGN